jgi:hypothetical protein
VLLTKTSYEPNDVITLKTTAGEEVVARIAEETDTYYRLTKPHVLINTPQGGFGLAPAVFSMGPNAASVVLNKHAVAFHGHTESELANQYLAKTTGLTIAKAL